MRRPLYFVVVPMCSRLRLYECLRFQALEIRGMGSNTLKERVQ